jgi:4-amino-4-deoxy-L-arabinose transferase-like glycosyltransferase
VPLGFRIGQLLTMTGSTARAPTFAEWQMPSPRFLLFFFLGTFALYALGNSRLPLIDRDEPRFAEASREMRQSGDYLVPRLNGEYRFDKPPLIYWSQVLTFDLLGDNDFAARLPSVVFAALTATATSVFAHRVFGKNVGIWAGLIFATCLQLFVHGRAAVADMPLLWFFLLATWAGWERLKNPRSKLWWWIFYLSVGLGFLAKGPVALLPMLFPPIHALLCRSPFRLRPGSACLGGLVLLIIIGAWGIPAMFATHGEYFEVGIGKHVLQRSLQPMESHGGPGFLGYLLFLPFYLIAAFLSFFPWCIFLPRSAKRLWALRDSDENYLLGAVLLVFFVFTFIQTKLPHYVLPAYPALAILVARQTEHARWKRLILVCIVAVYLVVATIGFSSIEPQFLSRKTAELVLPSVPAETRTASVHYDEPSLIWYLRAKIRPFHLRLDADKLRDFMNQPGPVLCVINPDGLSAVEFMPGWRFFRTSGQNFARWKAKPVKIFGLQATLPMPQTTELITVSKE